MGLHHVQVRGKAMGENVLETDSGVVVRAISAGTRYGFTSPTPAFAISTRPRVELSYVNDGAVMDYVVLTRSEAIAAALSILRDECDRQDMSVYRDYLRSIEVGLEKGKIHPGQADGPADLPMPE
jgi:hypothetical protein